MTYNNEQNNGTKRVLAIFAHNDDEFYCVGTLANHADAGHDVTLVFLSRGENSTFVSKGERYELSSEISDLLGVEVRYLEFEDSRIEFTVKNSYKVAEVIKEIKPHIIITWNKFNNIGEGHPDHRECADIVQHAISYARFKNAESDLDPYREQISFYKYYDHENFTTNRVQYVDVTHQEEKIRKFLDIYKEAYGEFPVVKEKFSYLGFMGRLSNVKYAEAFEVVTHAFAPKLLWG